MAKPNNINKKDLLTSAKQCLVEKGVEQFTLRAVAEAAGVTQGTVYYHFRTKEQLLLEVVKDVCESSWNDVSRLNENTIKAALAAAKNRCSYDSYFHKLFLTLAVIGLSNQKIREQLSLILQQENRELANKIKAIWATSPIAGVSIDTWSIFINAMIDGIALQALMNKEFPVNQVYEELECLLLTLNKERVEKK